MISLHINPPGIEEEFLGCLNQCFGGWGDLRKFAWYFRRPTPYPDADLMVFKKSDELVAGSAVTYRKVAFANGSEIIVGIMTGAWTLPAFRNQGFFARIIEESMRLTAHKGGALLLGFAVEERASFRQLARAGSALFPSFYMFTSDQTARRNAKTKLRKLEKSAATVSRLHEQLQGANKGRTRFIYSSAQEFYSQFLDRPSETEILMDDQGTSGIVERTSNTDLLQLSLTSTETALPTMLVEALISDALEKGRKLFLYTSQAEMSDLGQSLGLEIKQGYLTVLVPDAARLRDALQVSEPSIIENPSVLSDADSEWYLGNWNLQGGDRA